VWSVGRSAVLDRRTDMTTIIFIHFEKFPSQFTKTAQSIDISYIKRLKNANLPFYRIISRRRHSDRRFKLNSAKSAQKRTNRATGAGGGGYIASSSFHPANKTQHDASVHLPACIVRVWNTCIVTFTPSRRVVRTWTNKQANSLLTG